MVQRNFTSMGSQTGASLLMMIPHCTCQVVKGAPEILGPDHVALFAQFLAERLADW